MRLLEKRRRLQRAPSNPPWHIRTSQGGPGKPLGRPGGPGKPREVSGTSGNPGNPRETSGSSLAVQTVQGGPGKSVGLPRKPMSKVLPGPSVGRPDVPGASPVLPAGSYACPDVRRPTRTSHHFTRPSGLCWPRYINEVTTCHLRESTISFYSLLSA